jgi:hypothetical protein
MRAINLVATFDTEPILLGMDGRRPPSLSWYPDTSTRRRRVAGLHAAHVQASGNIAGDVPDSQTLRTTVKALRNGNDEDLDWRRRRCG